MIAQLNPRLPVTARTFDGTCLLKSFQSGDEALLFRFGKETAAERVLCKLAQLIAREALLSVGQQVFIREIGAKEGRVIGVDGHQQARVEKPAQRVPGKRGANSGAHV